MPLAGRRAAALHPAILYEQVVSSPLANGGEDIVAAEDDVKAQRLRPHTEAQSRMPPDVPFAGVYEDELPNAGAPSDAGSSGHSPRGAPVGRLGAAVDRRLACVHKIAVVATDSSIDASAPSTP